MYLFGSFVVRQQPFFSFLDLKCQSLWTFCSSQLLRLTAFSERALAVYSLLKVTLVFQSTHEWWVRTSTRRNWRLVCSRRQKRAICLIFKLQSMNARTLQLVPLFRAAWSNIHDSHIHGASNLTVGSSVSFFGWLKNIFSRIRTFVVVLHGGIFTSRCDFLGNLTIINNVLLLSAQLYLSPGVLHACYESNGWIQYRFVFVGTQYFDG